jgi:hypothetical protein
VRDCYCFFSELSKLSVLSHSFFKSRSSVTPLHIPSIMRPTFVTNIVSFLTFIFYVLAQSGNYPLMYGDSSILKGATQACIDTFNSNVTCTQAIGSLYADPYQNVKESVLDGLCTANCFNSLVDLRSEVISKCDSGVTYQDVSDSSYWPVTYLTDLAIFNYNMTCLLRRFVLIHDTS